ncbi:MAG: peptidoglycan-binding protein [Planctomycetes bacterium]|nr:peptidoglycan-binding protein [Planctomycetota bacterium]
MPEDYVVRPGDCVESVAFERGFFWQTLWDDPRNARLKDLRGNPNILLEGDVLHVPDRRAREHSGATESTHRFVRKGVPSRLRLRIVDPASSDRQDRPRANAPFRLEIDGRPTLGTTDADGRVDVPIRPDAREGRLILEPGTPRETVLPLQLGHLDPVSEESGVRQRLASLGFDTGDPEQEAVASLESALRAFQQRHGLEVTGQADAATRDKLREAHGG